MADHPDDGSASLSREDLDRVIAYLSQAVEQDPDNAVVLHDLGAVLAMLGEHARAVEALSRAIALEPQNTVYYDHRVTCFAARGGHDWAIDDLDRSISMSREQVLGDADLGALRDADAFHRLLDAYRLA